VKLRVVRHTLDKKQAEPLPTVNIPRPPSRYEIGARIQATLLSFKPGSDESFLVDNPTTAFNAAKRIGVQITTQKSGDKSRVWRIA